MCIYATIYAERIVCILCVYYYYTIINFFLVHLVHSVKYLAFMRPARVSSFEFLLGTHRYTSVQKH